MRIIQINGFFDIHTHILPGVDDGAPDMQTAMELINQAREAGTRSILLTPHYRGVYKKNTTQHLHEVFDDFRQTVREAHPDMQLYLGHEVHYQSEVPERLSRDEILTIAGSDYVLLEFRGSSLRSQILAAVMELLQYGYRPIVAHAERYDAFCKDPKLANEIAAMGALIQVNADSILGKRGSAAKRLCHTLLKSGLVHFVGSDAHDTTDRAPDLRKCYWHVRENYGAQYAARLFYQNARAIIEKAKE